VAEEPDAASLSRGVVAPPPTGAMRGMSKLMG